MKPYIIAALVAMAAIVGNAWLNKVQRLTAANTQLTNQLASAQQKADGYELLIQQLAADLAAQRQSQQQLLHTQSELTAAASQRAQTIRSLQRENQELKNWAAADLPEPVRCLRQRPALTGADAYTAWLSGSGALPPACQ